jgi:hypothetical protein
MATDDTSSSGPVAGWYPDPLAQADLRWFDGAAWTDHTRAHPEAAASDATAAVAATTTPQAAAAPTTEAAADAADAGALDDDAALLAAVDARRRTLLIGGLVVLVLLAILGGVLLLGGGGEDEPAQDPDAAAIGQEPATPPGVQGRVEGEPAPLDDPGAAITEAARQQAQSHVAAIVRGIQTCAIRNEDGSFTGCASEGVLEAVPSLRPILEACGAPGGGCIELVGGGAGYEVRVQDTAVSGSTWIETRDAAGEITRTCEPAGCTETSTWEP